VGGRRKAWKKGELRERGWDRWQWGGRRGGEEGGGMGWEGKNVKVNSLIPSLHSAAVSSWFPARLRLVSRS